MNIRMFAGIFSGANSYLVDDGEKTAFIVDAGEYSAPLATAVRDEDLRVAWLILTHGHGDHIGGAERYLREFAGCRLAAGADELPVLTDPSKNYSGAIAGRPISLVPQVLLKDGDALTAGKLTLRILATPGHSPGGICVLAEDALFCGDTLFAGSIGRTDLFGGSTETLLASISRKLFTLPDETRVYPGHMGESTIGFEKKNNPFFG
ncbi:MAG: MBL fold metallo-hydrolase [Clostridiales Family XIII bacterium]|jgi:glyoxylase-like metal-dependent hydrolase (beta-lactamase superfamily II)|nr:MBL fold metallo-hydrolase [Clostridiales Family XIII bacterium]